METEIVSWLSVILRFVHVLAAIMWIGDSLLFTWMEHNLIKPKPGDDPDKLGHLDMLHGGGVYHLDKRVLKAGAVPSPLHWFMWQSYTTWIAGFLLLLTLYASGHGSFFLDPTKSDLTGWGAIGYSLAGILGGWIVYDLIWRSPLGKKPLLGISASFVALIAAASFYNGMFNGRAVFLQIGAMMATMMSANVLIHIILNQKKFMAALEAGRPHNLDLGKRAKMRSTHNHYMTFPVLFLMLSAHFPQLTGADWNVAILGVIVVSLALIKFLMNTRYVFDDWLKCLIGTFVVACAVISILLILPAALRPKESPEQVAINTGKQLFLGKTCATCHMQGSSALAPDLHGVFGTSQLLTDGTEVVADEAYIRESILNPQARIVKGHAPTMPPFAGQLTDAELDALVAYIKSIGPRP